MTISHYSARAWGLFLLSISTIFLCRPTSLTRWIEKLNDESFLYLTGYVSLILGAATIGAQHLWVWDWRVLITLIGWGALLKGAGRLLFPEQAVVFEEEMEEKRSFMWGAFVFIFFLGLFLTYRGFFPEGPGIELLSFTE